MSYIWLYLILYLGCFVTKSHFKEINSAPTIAHGEDQIETNLVEDLLTENNHHLILEYGLNVACSNYTCEKYSLSNLEEKFNERGAISDYSTTWLHQLPEFRRRNSGSDNRNVIIWSVSVFTQTEADLLELIRTFSMKGFIVVIAKNEDSFFNLKRYVLKEELFNIYLLKPDSNNPSIYFMYEICAFCESGSNSVILYNSWKHGRGFLKPLKYNHSFKGQFFGANLKIGTLMFPPAFFLIGQLSDGRPQYYGQQYLILETLAYYLNFKFSVITPDDGVACIGETKQQTANGGWKRRMKPVGFCKLLQEKKVSMAGFAISANYLTSTFLDETLVYYQLGFVIITAKQPKTEKRFVPSDALKFSLIGPVFGSMILTVISLWAMTKIFPETKSGMFWSILFQSISIFLLEGVKIRYNSMSKRIVIGFWMVSCFFAISAIFGEMTSTAVKPGEQKIIVDDIEDMKSHGYSWITIGPYNYGEIFAKFLPEQAPRMKLLTAKTAFKFLHENRLQKYVVVFYEEAANPIILSTVWDGLGENPFYFSPRLVGISPFYLSILVRKDCPFREKLMKKLLHIEAAGLYRQKMRSDTEKYFAKIGKIKNTPSNVKDGSENELKLVPTIMFIGIVWGLATLIFIGEKLYFYNDKIKRYIFSFPYYY